MKLLLSVLEKAKHSGIYLWILNRLLWRLIPFNNAHKVNIVAVSNEQVVVELPYKKSNLNHLKGMHACALATLCEYACGIGLMTRLDPQQYRIILKSISVNYHAQAKGHVTATFEIKDDVLNTTLINPLQTSGVVLKTFFIDAYDRNGKHICTGEITLQLKSWKLV